MTSVKINSGGCPITEHEKAEIVRLHGERLSAPRIAAVVGRHPDTVRFYLRQAGLGGPPRPGFVTKPREVDPTPQELAERIAAVQATWSPQERLKRMVCRPTDWQLPVVLDPHFERKAG